MLRRPFVVAMLLAFVCGQCAAAPKVVNRWAVLIGVDDYVYAQKLQYCGADQLALSERLVASGIPADHVFLLHDKAEDPKRRPTLGNIDRHLNLIVDLAEADDFVLIAFSGHGVHLQGKSYFCPGDCTLDKPETLISVDDVYDRLKNCIAGFKLVLVDACRNDPHAAGSRGRVAGEGARALARSLDESVPKGVVLLNSCGEGEISWEDEKFGHGVFMHFILEGLQGPADTSGDGGVSLLELQTYAGLRTKTHVAQRFTMAQRPYFKGDLATEALEYSLISVPGGAKASVPPPALQLESVAVATTPAEPNAAGERPFVGLTLNARFTAETARKLGLSRKWGAMVLRVAAGSPAEQAGIKPGDVIVQFDGVDIDDDQHLVNVIARTKVERTVSVVAVRSGQWVHEKTKVLEFERSFMGVTLDSKFNESMALLMGLPRRMGTQVLRIQPNSPAAKSQLRVGDVILRFNGVDINDDTHLVNEIAKTKIGREVPMVVYREGQSLNLTTTLMSLHEYSEKTP